MENSGAVLAGILKTYAVHLVALSRIRSRSCTPSFAYGGLWAGVSCLATYSIHGKEGDRLKADTENCLVEKENQDISYFDQHFIQIMFCGILLNLLNINRKNKVSYHAFMLLTRFI